LDQRELVRKGEGAMADRFAIVLVMHLHDPNVLLAESRQFGSIVTDWYRARGATAESIVLAAVSEEKYHNAIYDWYAMVHAQDVTLRPIFQVVPFKIELHDSKGQRLAEHDFSTKSPPKAGLLAGLFGAFRKK
jgi:hypothetical protein